MKYKVIIILFLIINCGIGLVSFPYLVKSDNSVLKKTNTEKDTSPNLIKNSIDISPQVVKDKVTVNNARLSANGFVVVREIEGDKLSQIIEMSNPLSKGEHKNIEISLGNAGVSKNELIVMIYDDYANDGIFNDFDMPAINEEGFMTASYVKTGKPLPQNITEDPAMPAHNMPGMEGMVKVRYTDDGFIPGTIEVAKGSMVEFVNDSSTVMWVASAPHPQHTNLPTFDQFRTIKKGAIYRYIFDKKGKWSFHDHINPSRGGMVIVN